MEAMRYADLTHDELVNLLSKLGILRCDQQWNRRLLDQAHLIFWQQLHRALEAQREEFCRALGDTLAQDRAANFRRMTKYSPN